MPSLPPPRELTVAPYPVGGRRSRIAWLIVREAAASYDFSLHESQRRPVRFVIRTRSPSSTHSSVRDPDQFIAGFSQVGHVMPRMPRKGDGLGGRDSSSLRIAARVSGPMMG